MARTKTTDRKKLAKDSETGDDYLSRVDAPEVVVPQRDILQEGRQTLQLLDEAYPRVTELERKFRPGFAEIEADAAAARGARELETVRGVGTGYYDALQEGNPLLEGSVSRLNAGLEAGGPSEIETLLNKQALDELKLGGYLSPEETRVASQGARAAASSRGLDLSARGAVLEVLSREGASENRKAGRRAFASGVDTLSNQREASDNAFAQNAGQFATGVFDPQQRIFGSGGSAVSGQVQAPQQFSQFLGQSGQVGAANQQANLTGQLATMEDQRSRDLQTAGYIQDNYMTQYNAGEAGRISDANNKAEKTSAAVSVGASIAAIALIAF